MEWKHSLTRTPYLVLFVVLIAIGVGTASAMITITLAGNVVITDDLTVDTDTLVVDSINNEVGIGTNSPNSKLHVAGDAQIDGNVESVGGVIVSTRAKEDGNTSNLVIQRVEGSTTETPSFTLSHRTSDKDLWLYGYDGSTFKNFVGFDYPNYKINFPTNGDALVIDGASDQITIEGKDFEMNWNSRVPSNTVLSTVDSGLEVAYTSITIGADGLPIISYYDDTNDDLKVAKCTTSSCSSSTITTVDSAGLVGKYSSIAIGMNGIPIISYHDEDNTALKVAFCLPSCASASINTVSNAFDSGFNTSITIGNDGNPRIVFFEPFESDTYFVRCTDIECISSVSNNIIPGSSPAISMGHDGFPVFVIGTPSGSKIVKCTDQDCQPILAKSEFESAFVNWISVAVSSDNVPVVSYYYPSEQALKVAKCGNPYCISDWIRR